MDQTEEMKFLSKFTKQEIIEAIFQEISVVQVKKILSRAYFLKSERLLEEYSELIEGVETAKITGKFLISIAKIEKKNKEIDALYKAYNSLLKKKDEEEK